MKPATVWRVQQSRVRGFTLVEILVTIAVAGILISVAAPGLSDFAANARQSSEINRLAKSFRFARSEAIKRGSRVSVCARETDSTCGSDWTKGWLVFSDSTGRTGDGVALAIDGNDQVLRVMGGGKGVETLTASAIIRPNAMAAQTTVAFTSRGRSNWTSGTITVCDDRGADAARALIVNGAGTVRSSDDGFSSNGVPNDAVGNAVTC